MVLLMVIIMMSLMFMVQNNGFIGIKMSTANSDLPRSSVLVKVATNLLELWRSFVDQKP
jgi:hypothetical protein